MKAHLKTIQRAMHEFRIFMQAQLDERTPSQDQIREMNDRLRSLEQTCEYLQTTLHGESSNAFRGSGVGGRQGRGGDMGSSPSGSGGSRGSYPSRGGGSRSSRGGYY
jgi:hypothetical protein